MYRCSLPGRRAVLALAAASVTASLVASFGFVGPAAAQVVRNFPQKALRGTMIITDPSTVSLNRDPAQLSPAARIRGPNNLVMVWGAVAGQKLYVNYTLDLNGLVQDVWILTDEEADKRWPTTRAEADKWAFDPGTQSWSKP